MYGHISHDDQLLLDGWKSHSPELDLVDDSNTPLCLHTQEPEEDNVDCPAVTDQIGSTNMTTSDQVCGVSLYDGDIGNMHCTGVSETLNDPSFITLEVKALESSRRMDGFQQQADRISTLEDHLITNQTNQMTDPMTPRNTNPHSLLDDNVKASSGVTSKGERKRKRHAMEMKIVEDIKRREIERKRADAAACELSRNRSMFNGNKDTLPSIGKLPSNVDFLVEKLPRIKESDVTTFYPIDHDAISVISKHEARIRTTCLIKDIGKEFANTGAKMLEPFHKNMAPEIIESYEGEVGRPYERYGGYPTGSAILIGSYMPKTPSSGNSRNSMDTADQSPC